MDQLAWAAVTIGNHFEHSLVSGMVSRQHQHPDVMLLKDAPILSSIEHNIVLTRLNVLQVAEDDVRKEPEDIIFLSFE